MPLRPFIVTPKAVSLGDLRFTPLSLTVPCATSMSSIWSVDLWENRLE
jgi:hypothetical protein